MELRSLIPFPWFCICIWSSLEEKSCDGKYNPFPFLFKNFSFFFQTSLVLIVNHWIFLVACILCFIYTYTLWYAHAVNYLRPSVLLADNSFRTLQSQHFFFFFKLPSSDWCHVLYMNLSDEHKFLILSFNFLWCIYQTVGNQLYAMRITDHIWLSPGWTSECSILYAFYIYWCKI